MGVERTLAVLNGFEDNYLTELWQPIIKQIEKLSGKKYKENEKAMRIIADHIKASVFIIADGIASSNLEQGYVLRKLIRRAIRHAKKLGIKSITEISEPVFKIYPDYKLNKKFIKQELRKEEEKFLETLEKGLNVFNRLTKNEDSLSGSNTFLLHQSYGFPVEITQDLAKEKNIKVDKEGFEKEFAIHQALSRSSIIEGRFKSGLADDSEATTKLHTATHLLLAALKIVLKDKNIIQKGSNITSERLRFDFSFPRKLTKEEIEKVEKLVNTQIQKGCEIIKEEMTPEQAKKKGATGMFNAKYGEIISVYTIKNYSKEICSGPHVKNTCELGHFKIKKEESSSSGVRRIKAILE